MYGSKVCVQDFWYFVSGLDIQLEQSENHNPACKKTVCQFQVARYDESCTIFFNKFGMNSWVVKVSHIESGNMGSILAECQTFGCRQQFCVALRPSVHRHAHLYIAALSIIFSFLDLVSGNLVLTGFLLLNMNILLPLFWSTWSQALGQDLATCAGLAHRRDYSDCRTSEQKSQKVLGYCFSLNYRKYLKNSGPQWGFFKPHPPDWLRVRFPTFGWLFEQRVSGSNASLTQNRKIPIILLAFHVNRGNI